MARTWTDEELCEAVKLSNSYAQALTKMKLRIAGGNFTSIKKHIDRLNLDTSHFNHDSKHGIKLLLEEKFSDDKVFCENSTVSRNSLRRRFKEISEYKCSECPIVNEWNGKKLVLQMDHKNGINNDNRKENLRWLCPNCHSQTETYAGKNTPVPKVFATKKTRIHKRKVDYLAVIERYKALGSFNSIAKEFNISDKMVAKIVNKYS